MIIAFAKDLYRLTRLKIASARIFLAELCLGGEINSLLVYDQSSLRYVVDARDQGVGRTLMLDPGCQARELNLITSFVSPEMNCLVVGAHIGSIAIPLSKVVRSVDAIEANPDTFRLLEINCLINRCNNIELHNTAASNSDEKIKFLLSTDNSGGSKRLPVIMKRMYNYDKPRIVTVAATRLDDLLGKRYDAIIMDIEGSEVYALQGMHHILTTCRILVVEFIAHHLDYVANVSAHDFGCLLNKYFTKLYIPELDEFVDGSRIPLRLTELASIGFSSQGLVFLKSTPSFLEP